MEIIENISHKVYTKLFDPFLQYQSVKDVSEYLNIPVSVGLRQAKIKDSDSEDILWRQQERHDKADYRDYYSKNSHYLERQDWYNRSCDLRFLRFIPFQGNMLDYGCGTAYVAFKAKRKRKDISLHIADIPEALTKDFTIWRLKKHGFEFSWYDIDKEENDKFPVKFDFIRCHDVLEHTFHPDRTIKNLFESLESGGVLSFDFLKDDEFRKENTREAQELRSETLRFVEDHFDIMKKKGHNYLVRKK